MPTAISSTWKCAAKMTEPVPNEYVPIACELHSKYELAILRRRPLHLVWAEGNVLHDEVVVPLDLKTAHREEFLVCRAPRGETREIRLDRVRRMEPA